jgi:hypothetical protein
MSAAVIRVGAAVAVLVALGAGAAVAGAFGAHDTSAAVEAPAPATQAVTRQDLSSVVPVDATLGYAAPTR